MSTKPSRARAIERSLPDLLADIGDIREQAMTRTWKGNPHPDYGSALKACELEAKLLGLLKPDAAGSLKDASPEQLRDELRGRKLKLVKDEETG